MLPKSRRLLLGLLFAGSLLLALFLSPLGHPFRTTLSNSPSSKPHPPQKSPQRSAQTSTTRHDPNSPLKIQTWRVPPDLTRHLTKHIPNDDPFADAGGFFGSSYPFDNVQPALLDQGVPFPPNSWIRLDIYTGVLEARNLPENLALIDQLITDLGPLPLWVVDRSLFDKGEPLFTPESEAITRIQTKLKEIIIPEVHFQATTIRNALDTLAELSKELDIDEPNPARRGVQFRIQNPPPREDELDDALGLGTTSIGAATIRELHLKNVPIATVLQYMCDSSAIRYKVTNEGVTLLVARANEPEPNQTAQWHVAPAVIERLRFPAYDPFEMALDDPFADPDDLPKNREEWIAQRRAQPLTGLFKDLGISFPNGASIHYSPASSTLTITNTPSNFDLFEILLEHTAFELSKERSLLPPSPQPPRRGPIR